MKMKNNNKSILLGILLLVALAGAVLLVQQRQETRKGAAFANTAIMLLPSEKITASVGDLLPVHLKYTTEGNAQLYNLETVVCYDSQVQLLESESSGNAALGYGTPMFIPMAQGGGDSNQTCVKLIALKDVAKINLAATTGEVAVLKFKALSTGSGQILLNQNLSKATGENSASETDKWITVTDATGTSYEILGGVVGDKFSQVECNINTGEYTCVADPEGEFTSLTVCQNAEGCDTNITKYNRGTCNTATGKYSCTASATGQYVDLAECQESPGCDVVVGMKYSKGACNNTTGKYTCTASADGQFTTLSSCQDATGCDVVRPSISIPPISIPPISGPVTKYSQGTCNSNTGKYSCTASANGQFGTLSACQDASGCDVVTTGNEPWLKFRMSFLGVAPGYTCANPDDMKLAVSVLASDGTMKTYGGVVPTLVGNQGNLAYYEVKLKLTGFNYTDNIAVFVKGPKQLQGKYGINNQSEYYDKAGGQLMGLKYDEATTPLFNFEKYPLLAGDVTGVDGVQDGMIDGLDFSKVKTEATKRTSVEQDGYLLTDLNGNCQMESQDLALLMWSLSVKQDQMY